MYNLVMRSVRPSYLNRTLAPLHGLPRAPPQTLLIPRRIVTTATSNTAPIDVPKLVVSAGSKHHNSLATYLEYVQRKKVNVNSTVYVGTRYEYVSALALLRLGFSLIRTGRKSDAGIDLIGHWVLPPLREPLPVLVQCKSTMFPSSPREIRELEGSFLSIPLEWNNKDVLGLLVAAHSASIGVLHALSTSRRPLGFVKVTRDGTVEQLLWNHAAAERGLEGVGVTMRHTPNVVLPSPAEWGPEDADATTDVARDLRKKAANKFKTSGTKKDVQMTWLGSPIFPEREALDPETKKLIRGIEEIEDCRAKGLREYRQDNPPKGNTTRPRRPPRYSATGVRLGRPIGSKDIQPRQERGTGPLFLKMRAEKEKKAKVRAGKEKKPRIRAEKEKKPKTRAEEKKLKPTAKRLKKEKVHSDLIESAGEKG